MGQTAKSLGPEAMKSIRDIPDKKKEVEPSIEDLTKARYNSYDRESALIAGIVSWTSEVTLEDGIPDLDEKTGKLLFEAILDLSLPPVDPKEVEERQGKS